MTDLQHELVPLRPPERFDPQPTRPGALAQRLGTRHGIPAPSDAELELYGPTSRLTEGDLLRGYGLLPPRRLEDER